MEPRGEDLRGSVDHSFFDTDEENEDVSLPARHETPSNPVGKGEPRRSPLDDSYYSGGSSSSTSFDSCNSSSSTSCDHPAAPSDSEPEPGSRSAGEPSRRATPATKIPTGTPRDGEEQRYSDDFEDGLEEARTRLRSLGAGSPERAPGGGSGESGGSATDVTDVTPLSSAGSSPRGPPRRERRAARQQNLSFRAELDAEGPVSASPGVGERPESADDDDAECDEILRSVLGERGGRSPGGAGQRRAMPGGAGQSRRASAGRRNASFSNAECERIERENRRLLRELRRKSPAPQHQAAARPYHTAMHRQREHARIVRANHALLKKLEAAKVSPGLRRAEQLRDHARLTGQPMPATAFPSSRSSVASLSRPASHGARTQGRGSEGSSRASSAAAYLDDRSHSLQLRSLLGSRPAWDPRW